MKMATRMPRILITTIVLCFKVSCKFIMATDSKNELELMIPLDCEVLDFIPDPLRVAVDSPESKTVFGEDTSPCKVIVSHMAIITQFPLESIPFQAFFCDFHRHDGIIIHTCLHCIRPIVDGLIGIGIPGALLDAHEFQHCLMVPYQVTE